MIPIVTQLIDALSRGNKTLDEVTAEELSKLTRSLLFAKDIRPKRLLDGIHRVDYSVLSKSDWKRIRCLSILGNSDEVRNHIYEESGVLPGAYLNWDRSFLLLVHPKEKNIPLVLQRCSTDLKILQVFNTHLNEINISSLTGLIELRLWDNDALVHILGLDYLQNLSYLGVGGCKKLTSLPGLEQLCNLTELGISGCVNIQSLPNLEQLSNLSGLRCVRSGITFLNNDRFPPNLEMLKLDSTPITQIPEGIRELKCLRRLYLQNLHLDDLPDWLPEIARRFTLDSGDLPRSKKRTLVHLSGTVVEGVDMSIFEQPYEMVVKWFESRKKGETELLNEIKVIFLGNGDVGKTHTIARLMQDGGLPPKSYTGSCTPGIIIENKDYLIDGQTIHVHFWDFGGQDILYSMHRMFMTRRTVYVVMVDARNESKSQQAREWLDTVKSFAPDAPAMLIINKNDQNPGVTIDETSLKREYGNLKTVIDMSALKDSKEEFNSKFTNTMLNVIRESDILKEAWPKSWKRVKEHLQNMTKPYIFSHDYEEICANCEVEDNQEGLLGWFNDLGISFCQYQDFRLKNYVILRPDWITNAIYTILFNKKKDVDNGMISLEEINSLLNPAPERRHKIKRVREENYAWADISYVLDVVRKFSLSYAADRNTEFFPMLCKEDSKPIAQTYAEALDALEFHMKFDYLPNNVLHRLMVMRWAELDRDNIWLTGAHFVEKHTGLSAVVRIEQDILKIFVRAKKDALHAPNTYLSVIVGTVEQIRMDLKLPAPQKWLVYKLEGKQDIFDYEILNAMLESGQAQAFSMAHRNMIPIVDIMNQAEPAVTAERIKLLSTIIEACQDLQGSMMYWEREENDRNTVVRNKLRPAGYIIHDQTLNGRSSGGKRAGELDMNIRIRETTPWTICEALILKDNTKTKWNEHLEKLLDNYNTHGLDFLILLSYVDCDKQRFSTIWEGKNGYTTHIPHQGTDRFRPNPNSFEMVNGDQWYGNNLIKVAKCEYNCGSSLHTVYHIFIHMDKKPQ